MEEEVLGKAYDGRLMRRLLTYIRPYKLPRRCRTGPAALQRRAASDRSSAHRAGGRSLPRALRAKSLIPSWTRTCSRTPGPASAQISFLYLLVVIFGMFCDFGEQYIMQCRPESHVRSAARIDGPSAAPGLSLSTTTTRSAAWSPASPPTSTRSTNCSRPDWSRSWAICSCLASSSSRCCA